MFVQLFDTSHDTRQQQRPQSALYKMDGRIYRIIMILRLETSPYLLYGDNYCKIACNYVVNCLYKNDRIAHFIMHLWFVPSASNIFVGKISRVVEKCAVFSWMLQHIGQNGNYIVHNFRRCTNFLEFVFSVRVVFYLYFGYHT